MRIAAGKFVRQAITKLSSCTMRRSSSVFAEPPAVTPASSSGRPDVIAARCAMETLQVSWNTKL